MNASEVAALDWAKGGGLLPAVVQHAGTGTVLMLGFMSAEALAATLATRRLTLYSRSRGRLWTKGETSGHFVDVLSVTADCDRDALLVLARPHGPVCHTGSADCFHGQPPAAVAGLAFLARLEDIIAERLREQPEGSYAAALYGSGPRRMAQKVGEEGLEVALSAVAGSGDELVCESADLLFHLLLLLSSHGRSLAEVVRELADRHAARA